MWQTYRDHSGQYGYALYKGSLHFGHTTYYNKPIKHIYHRVNHSYGYGVRREYSDMMIRSNVPVQVKSQVHGRRRRPVLHHDDRRLGRDPRSLPIRLRHHLF